MSNMVNFIFLVCSLGSYTWCSTDILSFLSWWPGFQSSTSKEIIISILHGHGHYLVGFYVFHTRLSSLSPGLWWYITPLVLIPIREGKECMLRMKLNLKLALIIYFHLFMFQVFPFYAFAVFDSPNGTGPLPNDSFFSTGSSRCKYIRLSSNSCCILVGRIYNPER